MNTCTFRTMSFNVRGAVWPDGVNAWNHRTALNVTTIHQYGPDLIGFQEVQAGNMLTYRESLPQYDYFLGPENGNQAPYEFNPIFWKSSRFELIDGGGFWLSKTPEQHSAAWETASVRAASWVRLRCRGTGGEFVHLNTHLDHISERARQEGAKLTLAKLAPHRTAGLPILITGDFNCNPGSPPYQCYITWGCTDLYLEAGNVERDENYTFHAFEGDSYDASHHHFIRRVDWILASSPTDALAVQQCFIVRDHAHPRYPSDHYPVIADLSLEDANVTRG